MHVDLAIKYTNKGTDATDVKLQSWDLHLINLIQEIRGNFLCPLTDSHFSHLSNT